MADRVVVVRRRRVSPAWGILVGVLVLAVGGTYLATNAGAGAAGDTLRTA